MNTEMKKIQTPDTSKSGSSQPSKGSEWGRRTDTDSIKSQAERFQKWLAKVSSIVEDGRETFLMGDFNLELERRSGNGYNRKGIANMAYEELIGGGLAQLIEGPTH